ncbi:hypothetical protein MHYP_G00340490 [Metynnis hypsauchen]
MPTMFGGEGWQAVKGNGGAGGAEALGVMLQGFGWTLPASYSETDSALTDRQRTEGEQENKVQCADTDHPPTT